MGIAPKARLFAASRSNREQSAAGRISCLSRYRASHPRQFSVVARTQIPLIPDDMRSMPILQRR
jgi:hypothetical protein